MEGNKIEKLIFAGWNFNDFQWYNNILTNDESVEYHVEHSGLSCTEVSSVDVQIVGFAEETFTTQTVEIDENSGFRCNDAENPLGCYDYKGMFHTLFREKIYFSIFTGTKSETNKSPILLRGMLREAKRVREPGSNRLLRKLSRNLRNHPRRRIQWI